MDDITKEAGNFNFVGKTEGVTTAADAFKDEQIAKNNAATDALPSFKKKSGVGSFLKNNLRGIGDAAMSTFNFANTIAGLSKNTMSSDEMMGSGGTIQSSANGIGFTESRVDDAGIQNQINAQAKAATMTGLTQGTQAGGDIGKLFGPVGETIGRFAGGAIGGVLGFFGGKDAKEEAERQKRIAINRTNAANAQNREQAYTIGLRNEFNRENRTDASQSLFHAALGVENIENDVNPVTRRTKHKHLVDTAEHGVVSGFGNSFGSEGEQMISGKKDKNGMHKVHGIKRGPNDTALMDLKPRDSVMSRLHVDWETGLPIADAVALNAKMHGGKISAEDKTRYEMNQKVEKMLLDSGRRRGNVLPGYIGGTNKIWNTVKSIGSSLDWENIIPTATAFASAAQRDAQAEGGLRAPKSYVANPYEQDALQQLNSLHSDYYPVWSQQREGEASAWNGIRSSGGLSAGQKMLGAMGLANLTQQNMQRALFEHQGRENALRAQAAKEALQAGNQSATRQQQAYQWDEDMLAKAHAARLNMWETSAYDRQNALTQYFKNRWEKNQFDRTMGLYESNQKNDAEKTKAIIESLRNNKNNPVTLTGVADNAAMISIDPETGALRRIDPFSPKLLGPGLKNPSAGFKFPTTTPSTKRRSAAKRTKKGK